MEFDQLTIVNLRITPRIDEVHEVLLSFDDNEPATTLTALRTADRRYAIDWWIGRDRVIRHIDDVVAKKPVLRSVYEPPGAFFSRAACGFQAQSRIAVDHQGSVGDLLSRVHAPCMVGVLWRSTNRLSATRTPRMGEPALVLCT